ncbi:MAG TPA: hypothetical protein VEX86_16735 [Longimicrobium sp.]|nr:hypothetical protein [Longimicrobium sp.]
MKKLVLDLDSLAVDSFSTLAVDGRSTVAGHELAPTLKTICASLLASNPTCCPCTP